MRFIGTVVCGIFSLALCLGPNAIGAEPRHVVMIVWDGMRPDFVRPEITPTLSALAKTGVTFKNHHPVYLSTTEVNGTALATGVYPGVSGIIGNEEFRPDISPRDITQTQDYDSIRKGDLLTGGHYLAVPTVSELLRGKGLSTAVAGAKPVVLLHDRLPRDNSSAAVNLFAGKTLPDDFSHLIKKQLGEFPKAGFTSTNRDDWTTDALLGPLWEHGVPSFSVLWLSEPDRSQHAFAPGSPAAIAAIRHSDQMLSKVMAALDRKGVRTNTDVIVVSDHAFSTIQKSVNVAGVLTANGFKAYRGHSPGQPQPGEVMVIPNGGSAYLYVIGHEQAQIEKIVHFLQSQDFAGTLFTREPVAGAFTLEQAHMASPASPDIILALRWTSGTNAYGLPGLIVSDDVERGVSQGMHGSLSSFDMHNTCIAAGPDFKSGILDYLPTGNVDIAPTILAILGVEQHKLSGRVLREAMIGDGPVNTPFESRKLEASYTGKNFVWRQYLNYSEVNGVGYFDEANGERCTPRNLAVR